MMGKLIWWIYVQPLKNIILTMLVLPIVWTALHQILRKHQLLWKAINIVTLIISLAAIIYLTLYHRGEGEYDVILTPFHSFCHGPRKMRNNCPAGNQVSHP